MSIPLFKPSIRRQDMSSVLSCLVTDQIGSASLSETLVNKVAEKFHCEGGLALREYGKAINLVLHVLGVKKGDRVVLSPLAPAVYLSALESRGILPSFADVREEDACLDPLHVEEQVKKGAKAIFLHASLGRVPDSQAFAQFNVPLIEDIGEALGAHDGKVALGARGDYVLLPMEPEGIATCGGGTILLAKKKSAFSALKTKGQFLTKDTLLTDLNASLGLVQWLDVEQALEVRDKIAELYIQALGKGRYQSLAAAPNEGRAVPYCFPVLIPQGIKDVCLYAHKKGVETALAFEKSIGMGFLGKENPYPHAKKLFREVLLFPLYPTLGNKNVDHIAKVLATLP